MKELVDPPNNRRKSDAAHEVISNCDVGIEDGYVFMQFPKPTIVTWFPPQQAMEIAVALMKYARRAGLKAAITWPAEETKARRNPNSNEYKRGED